MPTLDDINWNELPIVAKENGQVSVWKAWKRSICAFNDPRMWQGPEKFAEYFEKMDGPEWGMAGYGVIVVDFDAKMVVSLNDFSTPSSFFPLNENRSSDDPSPRALRALLEDPSQWPHVKIELGPGEGFTKKAAIAVGLLGAEDINSQIEAVSLDRLLPSVITPDQAMDILTLKRGCLKVDGVERIFFNGKYLPEGWIQIDDRGMEMPEGLVEILHTLHKAGFPAPQWEDIESKLVHSYDLAVSEDDIASLADDAEDQEQLDWAAQLQATSRSYLALKQQWSTQSPASPRSHPRP